MDRPGDALRSLVIDMDAGEALCVTVPPSATHQAQTVRVQMLAKSGKRARVRVLASPVVQVHRTEKDEIAAAG
jgi:hypothetical protein